MEENSKWKTTALAIGGIGGLLVGLTAAFLFIRSREENETDTRLTSSQGMKIGLGIVALLKQIAEGGIK